MAGLVRVKQLKRVLNMVRMASRSFCTLLSYTYVLLVAAHATVRV